MYSAYKDNYITYLPFFHFPPRLEFFFASCNSTSREPIDVSISFTVFSIDSTPILAALSRCGISSSNVSNSGKLFST